MSDIKAKMHQNPISAGLQHSQTTSKRGKIIRGIRRHNKSANAQSVKLALQPLSHNKSQHTVSGSSESLRLSQLN